MHIPLGQQAWLLTNETSWLREVSGTLPQITTAQIQLMDLSGEPH